MPLVKATLEAGILAELQTEFKSPAVKTALRSKLDGGSLGGSISSAKSLDKALGNIQTAATGIAFGSSDIPGSSAAAKLLIKKVTSNEMANAITDSITEWLSEEIAPIMAKTIADQVDLFVKSGTVIVTTNGVTVGAPSPHAITEQPGTGSVI